MPDNSYSFQCDACGAVNTVSAIAAFRPTYEHHRCWSCDTVNEVNTTTKQAHVD